jgi:glutaconate CoA-transferase subunit B
MADLFGLYLQGGRVEVAFLGGAQIDRLGNLNTTVIGDSGAELVEAWACPKVRLPGSGGACEIAINAQKVFVIMRLKRRAFVERLHFRTSPGHLDGKEDRQQLGLPGAGPQLIVTDKCVFGFDEETREMTLESLYPGVTLQEVEENVGWDLRVASDLQEVTPPAQAELSLLREELDPQGLYR